MPAQEALSDTVVFELPDRTGAERLWERLRLRWFGGVYHCDEAALVTVELRPAGGDLSVLLRAVELWVADTARGKIRFHLDGRAYWLRPASATWRATAA